MLRLHFETLLLSSVAGLHLIPSSNGQVSILTAQHPYQKLTLLIPEFQPLQ